MGARPEEVVQGFHVTQGFTPRRRTQVCARIPIIRIVELGLQRIT